MLFDNKIFFVLFQILLASTFVCSKPTEKFPYSLKLKHEMRSAQHLRDFHAKNFVGNGKDWLGMGKYYISNYPKDLFWDAWKIGTPGVNFVVTIESGHNRLWLIDSSYENVTNGVTTYNASASSTSVKIDNYENDYTGTTRLEGSVYADQVDYFGFTFNQSFGVILTATDSKTREQLVFEIDGVNGLAWSPDEDLININASSSPILNVFNSVPVSNRVYSFWLSRQMIDGNSDGVITFASFNNGTCSSDIYFVPLTYYNEYSPLSFQVEVFEIGKYSTKRRDWAKVDTGLPVIFLPESPYKAVYNLLKLKYDSELHILKTDCSNQGVFPSLIFTIGGQKFAVKSWNYVMDIDLDDGNCAVLIDQSTENDIPWGLGNPFLREYCEHFDIDNQRLGFSTSFDSE